MGQPVSCRLRLVQWHSTGACGSEQSQWLTNCLSHCQTPYPTTSVAPFSTTSDFYKPCQWWYSSTVCEAKQAKRVRFVGNKRHTAHCRTSILTKGWTGWRNEGWCHWRNCKMVKTWWEVPIIVKSEGNSLKSYGRLDILKAEHPHPTLILISNPQAPTHRRAMQWL